MSDVLLRSWEEESICAIQNSIKNNLDIYTLRLRSDTLDECEDLLATLGGVSHDSAYPSRNIR